MSHKAQIEIELTDQFLSDILVTAFDADYGGCWYWARPFKLDYADSAWEIDKPESSTDSIWRSVSIQDRTSEMAIYVVSHEVVARGIEILFKPGVLPKRGDLRDAVLRGDSGDLDSEGADVIVQLGTLGALIYG